jgi:predicted transcriptional regulator
MAQLTVRIDDDLKDHLQALARREGKSTSDVVRGLVQRYVRDRDRGTALKALWDRMHQNAEEVGAAPEDVDRAIQAVREESGAEESRGESPPAEGRS